MASQGLRTLCLAYADVTADALGPLASLEGAPPQLPLTACCVLGIKVSSDLAGMDLPGSCQFFFSSSS